MRDFSYTYESKQLGFTIMARPKMDGAQPAPPSANSSSPKSWWQWFLVYPALAISLLSAAPQWIDKAQAVIYDVKQDSYQLALRENKLWRENTKCAAAPYAWYTSPRAVRVDATICESGDVFVRATAPGGTETIKWLALDDVLGTQEKETASLLIPSAQAASPRFDFTTRTEEPHLLKAQYQNVFVVCQRFMDQRMLLRHVTTAPGVCFDELIDTFNGSIIRRNPVPCRPTC